MPNLLFSIMMLLWLSLYVYMPFQTPYLNYINVSASTIGVILGVYGASQFILRFPLGIINDYIGKCKIFITAGCLFAALGSLFRLINLNANGFLIGGILSGISVSTWMMYIILYASFFDKLDEHTAASKSLTASVSGMFIGFLIAAVFYEKLGMNFLLIISVISGSIGAILSIFIKENTLKRKSSIKELIFVIKNRRLIFFSILSIVQQGIQMAAAAAFTLSRLENLGANNYIIGTASIFNMISAIFSAYLSSKKSIQKFGPQFYVPAVFISLAVYCIIVISTDNINIILYSQLLSGFSAGMLASYLTSEAIRDIDKEKKSSAMFFFQAIYSIGIFLYPIITGKLADMYSINIAYIVLSITAVLSAVFSIIYYKLNKK